MTVSLQRILVPTDFSEESVGVLPIALALAAPSRASVLLAHYTSGRQLGVASAHMHDLMEQNQGASLDAVVEAGDVVSGILSLADAEAVDLIVMATHGRSGLVRAVLGSTAEEVVRRAGTPVMVVRRPSEGVSLALRRILVPTDLSTLSLGAVQYAAQLASQAGAVVQLLYVVEADSERGGAETMGHMRRRLHAVGEGLRLVEGVRFEVTLCFGTTAAVIHDVALQHGADIIVMGTHGRSGISRWVMGSTAETVVRAAPCPVLTLRCTQPDGVLAMLAIS